MPFPCTPENNHWFKLWVIERFEGSPFNKCPHQKLLGMTGPYLRYHMKPGADAESKPVHTPAVVPLHWEEKAKRIWRTHSMVSQNGVSAEIRWEPATNNRPLSTEPSLPPRNSPCQTTISTSKGDSSPYLEVRHRCLERIPFSSITSR